MPITLKNWSRSLNDDRFNTLGTETLGPVNVPISQTLLLIQAGILIPSLYKIRKVAIFYTATTAVDGSETFQLVVGTAAATTVAPNDNSEASGTSIPSALTATNGAGVYVASAGVGYPTNVATAGMTVFSAPITIAPAATTSQQAGAAANSAYAPGWIAAAVGGGYGIFVPPNYDAVYPSLVPITLRAATSGAQTITGLAITLFYVPVTPLANPGSGTSGVSYCIPGVSF